ncbi:tetratricopeptide repeat protein [Micromonospora pisi]|uniref:Tetratricopeptide repeat protein n=1 Tax=Micromonospora pisi TaxID=589240 RepID=A0A495JQD3_9ACTN|nr:tetratricopeptide repeat protein [Micromonospora pisi]RKR91173.1 tetratricopeptide repeat protein [Micromonospora pisi]
MSPGFGDLTPQAQQLVAAGDLAGAQELLSAALNSADPSPAHASPELTEAAGLQARVLVALGEPHSARGWAAFAYAAATRLHGPSDPRTVASAATLAAVLHRVGSHERAARLYRDVIIELTATDGPESLRVLAAHADLATVEYAQGECQLARNRLEDAWELHREVYGDGHLSGIRMLARLGSMQRDCGHFAEAHEHLALARELCREHLPADHPLAVQVAALARAAANPDHSCADGQSAEPDRAPAGHLDPAPSATTDDFPGPDSYPAPADAYPGPDDRAAPTGAHATPNHDYPAPATSYVAPGTTHPPAAEPYAAPVGGYPPSTGSYPPAAASGEHYPAAATPPGAGPPDPPPPPRMPPPRVPPPRSPVDHGPFGPGASPADAVYPASGESAVEHDSRWWPPDRAEPDPDDEPADDRDGWTASGRSDWRTDQSTERDNDSWAHEPSGTDWNHAPAGSGWDRAPAGGGWDHPLPGGGSPLPPAVPGMTAAPGDDRFRTAGTGGGTGTRHLPERRQQAKLPVRIYQPPRRPLRRTLPVIVAGLVVVLLGTVAVVAGFALTSDSDPGPTGPGQPTPNGPSPGTTPEQSAPAGPVATPPVTPGAPPSGLSLRDSRDSVSLSWTYPPGAEGPVVISAGRTGQDPRAIHELPPGTDSFIVYSLNRNTDYCFTVAVVYSVDLVGRSEPVCTKRTGAS